MKDVQGNDLQAARFKDMITEFYGLMNVWVNNGPVLTLQGQDRIDSIKSFLNIKARLKLDKNELNPSANFAVNIANYTAPGTGTSNPNNFRRYFYFNTSKYYYSSSQPWSKFF